MTLAVDCVKCQALMNLYLFSSLFLSSFSLSLSSFSSVPFHLPVLCIWSLAINFLNFLKFYNCIIPVRFLPRKIRVAFLRESQQRQSNTTQPTVHAECFNVSIIHRTLTWTTGSLTCVHMLMHAIAHGGVRTP